MNIEKKDQELFNNIAYQYARKDKVKSSIIARRSQILTAIKSIQKKNEKIGLIIDVGCGIGATANYLNGYYDEYIGIDQSEELISIAKQMSYGANAGFVNLNVKDISSDQFSGRKADLIIMIGALHHMTEFDKVFNTIKNVTKPGTKFLALEPQNGNPFVQILRRIRKHLDPSYSKEQVFFSPDAIRNILTSNGISVSGIRYQGYFVPIFAQIILKPQIIAVPLSIFAVNLDAVIERYLPNFLKKLSWNLIVYGEFK